MAMLSDLKRFVPRAVYERKGGTDVYGIVVLFDIVGFTAMLEGSEASDEEAARVAERVNSCFNVEIELVVEYGGDVHAFLGDGLLAVWSVSVPQRAAEGDPDPPSFAEVAAVAAARAVQCCLHVQRVFAARLRASSHQLRLRAAVAAGLLREYRVGSDGSEFRSIRATRGPGAVVPGRMVYFAVGSAISEAGAASGLCRPGETVLCPSVLAILPPSAVAVARRLDGSNAVVARSDAGELLDAFLVTLPPAALNAGGRAAPTPDAALDAELTYFVPYTVRARLRSWGSFVYPRGLGPPTGGDGPTPGGSSWDPARYHSEFRSAAVLFAQLSGLASEPAAVQRAVLAMQRALYTWGGSLRQVTMDDKGLVFIGVFGLWPLSHEDDPTRALLCAADLKKGLAAMGVAVQIGVASGLVFCTYVGNETRCEFSVFGSVVNRAARLMVLARGEALGTLTDAKTAESARQRVSLEAAGEHALKGFQQRVLAFRPVPAAAAGLGSLASTARPLTLDLDVDLEGDESPRSSPAASMRSMPPARSRPNSLSPTSVRSRGALSRRQARWRLAGRSEEADALATRVAALGRPAGSPVPTPGRPPPSPSSSRPSAASVTLLEAGAGLGKTALVSFAVRIARGLVAGAAIAVGRASETAGNAPFHAFRGAFAALFPRGVADMAALAADDEAPLLPQLARLFGLPGAPDADLVSPFPRSPSPRRSKEPPRSSKEAATPGKHRPSILVGDAAWAGEGPRASLLMEGRGGGDLRSLLVALLRRRAAAGPVVLVLEDMHGADTQSWSALLALAAELQAHPGARLAVLVALRPPDERPADAISHRTAVALASAAAAERLSAMEGVLRIKLGPLDETEVAALLRTALGASGPVPAALRAFVHRQSGGVPGLAVDIARALLERGDVRVDEAGRCLLVRSLREGTRNVSDAVRAALCERLDRLSTSQMLALKLASVVGSDFAVRDVAAIHPLGVATDGRRTYEAADGSDDGLALALAIDLSSLVPLAILARVRAAGKEAVSDSAGSGTENDDARSTDASGGEDTEAEGGPEAGGGRRGGDGALSLETRFRFRSSAMRDVVYGLLAVPERKLLHHSLAVMYETRLAAARAAAAAAAAMHASLGERGPRASFRPPAGAGPEGEDGDDLATVSAASHHFLRAGEPQRAGPYLERSARLALRANAYVEAARLYEDLAANGAAPAARRAAWTRSRASALQHIGLYREAVAAARDGLALLGRPLPVSRRGALLRFAVLAARLAAARLPDPYALRPAPDGEEREAASEEASRLYGTITSCAERTNDDRSLLLFAAASAAWEALRQPRLGPAIGFGAAVWADVCALLRWEGQAERYAALASACVTQVDRMETYLAALPHLCAAEMTMRDYPRAQVTLRVWLEIADRSGAPSAGIDCLHASAALQRRCPTLAWPGGPARLAPLLEGVLARGLRLAEGLSDLHATVGAALHASLLLQLDEAAAALAALEAHARRCDADAVALVSAPAAAAFFAVYAQALLRCAGLPPPSPEPRELGKGGGAEADPQAAVAAGRAPRTLAGAVAAAERALGLFLSPEHPRGDFLAARHEVAVEATLAALALLLAAAPAAHPAAAALRELYGAGPPAGAPEAGRLAALAEAALERVEELVHHAALRPLSLVARALRLSLRSRFAAARAALREAADLPRDWRGRPEAPAPAGAGRKRALALLLMGLHEPPGPARSRLLAQSAAGFEGAADAHFARLAAALAAARPGSQSA